jgi:hypothetical protein
MSTPVERMAPAPQSQGTKQSVEVQAEPSGNLVSLQAFADLHAVSRNETERLWKTGFIAGQRQGTGSRASVMINTKGQRDFWAQLHETPGFRACDLCPHSK